MIFYSTTIIFTVIQILEVGIRDGIECQFVNKPVHIIHNFPDILKEDLDPKNPHNFFKAMQSGMKAVIIFLPVFALKALAVWYFVDNDPYSLILKSNIFLTISYTLCDSLALITFDRTYAEKVFGKNATADQIRTVFQNKRGSFDQFRYFFRIHVYFYWSRIICEVLSIASIISVIVYYKRMQKKV